MIGGKQWKDEKYQWKLSEISKKNPVKIHGKIRENVFKSGFLRINGSPLIDCYHGLLIIY